MIAMFGAPALRNIATLALCGLSLVGCSRSPKLPYDLAGLGADGKCGRPAVVGCADLSVPSAPKAPAVLALPAPPPARPPAGGLRLIVSLPQQRLYAYRDGVLIATSPVSTGKRGHSTPTGTFHITQKQIFHRSNRYSNAPMPYMERLTASGIALHAGHLPGYPASHGCIRLPMAFAKRLYRMTSYGSPVTVTRVPVRGSVHRHRRAPRSATPAGPTLP